MDWKPGTDMYIGLSLGFVMILGAAWLLGVPGRDLALIGLVFALTGITFVLALKRLQRDRRR